MAEPRDEEFALVACFPGCGWNGEVELDEHRQWACPGCGVRRMFRSHREEGSDG